MDFASFCELFRENERLMSIVTETINLFYKKKYYDSWSSITYLKLGCPKQQIQTKGVKYVDGSKGHTVPFYVL